MPTTLIERVFFFILLGLVLIFMIAIFYPFITVLILAASFAVVLSPVYLFIKKRLTRGRAWIASLITIVLFIFVICAPLIFIGSQIVTQTQDAYTHTIATTNSSTTITSLTTSINSILPQGVVIDVGAKITDVFAVISKNITNVFSSLIETIVLFVLMIIAIFYLLKDGAQWRKSFINLFPLSETTLNEILLKLSIAINQIIRGTFIIAIIQGVLIGIGLFAFGVPNALLWGFVAGIMSFVPTVGTSIVSIPAILFLFMQGMPIHAFGLLLWSALLVGMIDNLLAPFIISKDTKIPSLFILFAILGGISLIGPIGILIGPLALSLLYALISIYRKEKTS